MTLGQVLEISRLETATQQSLSQLSNKNLQSTMSDTTRRERIKVESLHSNNIWENFMDLDLCLQTANQMVVENSRLEVKSVIDVGKANISQIRNVVP